MIQSVGLGTSQKETAVCVVEGNGKVLFGGGAQSDPGALDRVIRKRAPDAERTGLEAAAIATWLRHQLKRGG